MDQKLYKRFTSDVDLSTFDDIVVGSGIGGLTTAVWLAKAGRRVAILERHYTPGGFTHTFKRNHGFSWDVGVHYVGNMHDDSGLRHLFDFISGHTLDWQYMGEVYDITHINGDTYEFKAGKEAFREQMVAYFPEEAAAIDAYLRLLKKSNKMAGAFFMEKTFEPFLSKSLGLLIKRLYRKYSQKSTYEVLKKLTNNERLITVLCAQCGNYGLSPKHSSFAAHALVIGHFMEGGFFPKGGASALSKSILENLQSLGAEIYINANVTEIVTIKKRVQGIKVNDTFIPCKSVISNVGVKNTFNHLLSEEARTICKVDLKGVETSTSHLCLYVGLDKSDKELGLPSHNVWSFRSDNIDDLFENTTLKEAPSKFAYISFPSAKDEEWQKQHPDKATIQALTIAKYDWFKKYEDLPWRNRGEEYEGLKKEFETTMLNHLYELFPQIKGHVQLAEVSTPLSTKHFSNYQTGEIYGLAHTLKRFRLPFLRPTTKIRGLRLVGQDITLVGVAGAMTSGLLCAISLLKWRIWKVFRLMSKEKEAAAE